MWGENDKITHLVVRLIGLTNGKRLQWKRRDPEIQQMPHDRHYLNYVYVAQTDKDIFRLSEYEAKIYQDEANFVWSRDIDLEIIDSRGLTLWRCPSNPAVYDLFRIVVESTADIDGVMARLDTFAQAS